MGTPNIKGRYEGSYGIIVRKEGGEVQARGGSVDGDDGEVAWTFDFDSEPKTLTLNDGRLTPQPGLPMPWFKYRAEAKGGGQALPLTDNGDGTYSVASYVWRVYPMGMPMGPFATTRITLDITQLTDGSINVVTTAEADGIPGIPLPSPPFPIKARLDWHGRASKV